MGWHLTKPQVSFAKEHFLNFSFWQKRSILNAYTCTYVYILECIYVRIDVRIYACMCVCM